MDVNQRGDSPLVEGCSPIRSCSPFQSRPIVCMWASPTHISPILQDKENIHPSEPLPTMDLDASSTGPHAQREGFLSRTSGSEASVDVLEQMDQDEQFVKDTGGNIDASRRESEDEEDEVIIRSREESCGWVPEEDTASPARLSSSQTVSVPNAESTHMFVSLLAEGSITPYDISMQVSMRAVR